MRVVNKKIITDSIMNTTITSPAIPLEQIFGYAVQASFTATPTGTAKLQASVDPVISSEPGEKQPTHWDDIPASVTIFNSAGTFTWNVSEVQYTWVRIIYTDGSGGTSTALLNVQINLKGF